MNDPSELQHGFKIVKEIWDKKFPSQSERFNTYDLDHGRFFFLATSFSRNKDLLSQWRSYGGDGHGFAIGISENDLMLANVLRQRIYIQGTQEPEYLELDPAFTLGEIFYEEQKYRNHIKSKINSFKKNNGVPFEKKHPNEPLKSSHLYFFNELLEDSCLLKSDFYKEEQEVRLFSSLWRPNISSQNVAPNIHDRLKLDFTSTRHGLKAFSPIQLTGNGIRAIKEIVIGPKSQSSKEEVKLLLTLNSFDDCEVTNSRGELR